MEQLSGRVAVVTGAAGGIGLATATAFLAEGMRVVMADVDAERVVAEARRLAEEGAGDERSVVGVGVDVRDADSVDAVGALAVERFGGLHVAMNNAGIIKMGWSWELSLDEWRDVLDVNLWGVIHGIRAFVPRILATSEEGHVVNTGSLASVLAYPAVGPYVASKHAVLGLSDVLRMEMRAKDAPVGVSVLMPGQTRTGMNPGGTVDPATVAANVVDALRTGRPYVFTDGESAGDIGHRLDAIGAALGDVVGGPLVDGVGVETD